MKLSVTTLRFRRGSLSHPSYTSHLLLTIAETSTIGIRTYSATRRSSIDMWTTLRAILKSLVPH
jgi:hypothetical protein